MQCNAMQGYPGGAAVGNFGGFGAVMPDMAGPGLQVLGDVATSPLRKLLSQGPAAFAACTAPSFPLALPRLGSAFDTQPELQGGSLADKAGEDGSSDASRRRLQMDLPSSSLADDQLTSPPLYMALQSPLIPRQSGTDNGTKGNVMFSPCSFPAFSPARCGVAIPSIDGSPAALRSLFPPDRELDGHGASASMTAAEVAASRAAAAPVVLKGEHPTTASWVFVPQAASGSATLPRAGRQESPPQCSGQVRLGALGTLSTRAGVTPVSELCRLTMLESTASACAWRVAWHSRLPQPQGSRWVQVPGQLVMTVAGSLHRCRQCLIIHVSRRPLAMTAPNLASCWRGKGAVHSEYSSACLVSRPLWRATHSSHARSRLYFDA